MLRKKWIISLEILFPKVFEEKEEYYEVGSLFESSVGVHSLVFVQGGADNKVFLTDIKNGGYWGDKTLKATMRNFKWVVNKSNFENLFSPNDLKFIGLAKDLITLNPQ